MNEVKPALTREEWLEYAPLDRTLAHDGSARTLTLGVVRWRPEWG